MSDDVGLAFRNWRSLLYRLGKLYSWKEDDIVITDPEGDDAAHRISLLWAHVQKIQKKCGGCLPPLPNQRDASSANEYISNACKRFLVFKDARQRRKLQIKTIIRIVALFVLASAVYWMCSWVVAVLVLIVVFIVALSLRSSTRTSNPIRIYLEKQGDPDHVIKHLRPPKFQMVDTMEECDIMISSGFAWGDPSYGPQQTKLLEHGKRNKKVAAFWVTDSEDTFSVPKNVFFFRTSLHRSFRMPTEDVLAFVFDPLDPAMFYILPTTSKPIVGFCGGVWACRKGIVELLKKDDRFTTNFIEREHFGHPDKVAYEDNIRGSHFTICNRGNGNFSMRFYHTLSVGRIPILIDTDLVLPFYDEIPWDNICVRAHSDQELADKTHAFYERHNMEDAQKLCFKIYQKYFRPDRYFTRVFENILK